MATLYIAEYKNMGAAGDTVPAAMLPALNHQAVTISGTSAQSAAMNAQTRFVRVQSDTNCFLLGGTNPTATTSSMPLTAFVPEYFAVPENVSFKIAGITA